MNDGTNRKFDLVVEATGTPDGFPLALSYTRPRGVLVLKSTTSDAPSLNLAPVVIDEIAVIGSRCGPFSPALESLSSGTFKPEETIGARYQLEEVSAAFDSARQPEDPTRRKVLLDIG